MIDIINTTISIITLTINGINASIKEQIIIVDQKIKTQEYVLQETHFIFSISSFLKFIYYFYHISGTLS